MSARPHKRPPSFPLGGDLSVLFALIPSATNADRSVVIHAKPAGTMPGLSRDSPLPQRLYVSFSVERDNGVMDGGAESGFIADSNALLCSSLALTEHLPAMPRPRESMRRGNHSLD